MKPLNWLDYLLAGVCFLALPALSVGLSTYVCCQMAAISGSSVLFIGTLGFAGGTIFLGVMIAVSAHDMTDFAVSSVVLIILALTVMPTRRNISYQALREDNSPSTHQRTQKSAPQR